MNNQNDFFALYEEDNERDQQCAERIVTYLEQHNLRGHAAYRDHIPGQTIFNNFHSALKNSRYILVLVSRQSLEDRWFERQMQTSLKERMDKELVDTIIPIYLPGLTAGPTEFCISEGMYYNEDPQDDFWRRLHQIFS